MRQSLPPPWRHWLAIPAVALGSLVLSGLLVLGIRAAARTFLHVPHDFPSLTTPSLVPMILLPVLGCVTGYHFSFRQPKWYSTRSFLLGSVIAAGLGLAVCFIRLPAEASVGAIGTVIAIGLAPALTVGCALLVIRPAPAEASKR